MLRALLTVPTTGLLAGLLLFQVNPDGVDARSPEARAGVGISAPLPTSASVDTPPGRDTTEKSLPATVDLETGLSSVTGAVVSSTTSKPISSVLVSLKRLNRPQAEGLRTQTDVHGRFRFKGIPSGDYLLSTHRIGFLDRTDTIAVGHGSLVSLDVPLTTQAVELPPLRVEVRSAWLADRGFYWRKERGLGQFLTPEEISRRGAQSFSGLVRSVQGVEVVRVCDGGGFPCPRMIRMRHTNDARACRVKYFMDGQPLTGRVHPDDISARDIAAVEIYRSISETPARFYGRCGSVVLWTKRFDPYSGNP